jgi:hypothetical protein
MKLARIAVLSDDGTLFWSGSVPQFIRDNEGAVDGRRLVADLRAGMNAPHGRPEPASLGGGAAPLFHVSLVQGGAP